MQFLKYNGGADVAALLALQLNYKWICISQGNFPNLATIRKGKGENKNSRSFVALEINKNNFIE